MKHNLILVLAGTAFSLAVGGCKSDSQSPAPAETSANAITAPVVATPPAVAAPATQSSESLPVLEFGGPSVTRALAGKQTSTTRQGIRHYPLGAAVMKSQQRSVPIVITELKYNKFSDLTLDEAQSDGYATLEQLKTALRGDFPDIAETDQTTTVYFKVIQPTTR